MNLILNFIAHNRPLVVLVTLVGLSLLSLIIGTEASIIRTSLSRVISLSAYPILKTQTMTMRGGSYFYGLFLEYDTALEETAALKQEVVRLKTTLSRQYETQAENQRLRQQLNFVERKPELTLQPARIIENFKGTLTIDQGRFQGILPSMPVITERGVAGVVIEVNDFTAIVATLHHMDCKIGAMVHRNRIRAYDGVIHASGNDWGHLCTMEYIDMKNDVRQGDLVVTSPESIFPAGFPIGTVSRVFQTGSLWKTAEIDPYVDPYSLDEVYIVRRASLDSETRSGLERIIGASSKAPEQPDTRTIQEKLAP